MILVVDDHADVARALRIAFQAGGYDVHIATGPDEALSKIALRSYDAILLDLNFTVGRSSGEEGLACLERIMADDPFACIIVITAHSGLRMAVAAMQSGARDFVTKPWRNAELLSKVQRAMQRSRKSVRSPGERQHRGAGEAAQRGAILVGDSPAIANVRNLVARVAPTAAGVAITGPSGSGRGLVAQALHERSAAGAAELVAVDLRDPDAWRRFDAETGSVLLRHSDLLDDVLQARLAAELDPGVRPIAILDDIRRLIPPLKRRIATVEIAVPPLSARGGDALLLARHFLRLAAERHGLPLATLTPAAEALVLSTDWPDQVRGLAAAIERAAILTIDGIVDAAAIAQPSGPSQDESEPASAFDLGQSEKAIISAALREHHHNVTQAAAALGLSRGSLYRRMERYGL